MEMPEEIYTPREVARMFRVSTATVWRLIRKGEIRAIRIGGQYRIPASAISELRRRK